MATKREQNPDSTIDRKSVRSALRCWRSLSELGEHSLARLNIVKARRRVSGQRDDSVGRGAALRYILRESIEKLGPDSQDPSISPKSSRYYTIIARQYLEGRSPDKLAQDELYISRSHYNHEQARALDTLVDILREREQNYQLPDSLPTTHQIPFLAPPRPPYRLVGRGKQLRNLRQRLLAGDSLSLAALNGLPGVGKTALAIELAHDSEIIEHFRDGVLWAPLGRHPNLLSELGKWGAAIGMTPDKIVELTSINERAEAIHAAIGMRQMLLIVDDAWDAEAALAFRLGGPNCAHLMTTRLPDVAVYFAGEGVILLPELNEADSLSVLMQLASEVVKAAPVETQELTQAIGGLPLALVLLGSYLQIQSYSVSPSSIFDRIRDNSSRMFLAKPQGPLDRHPSLSGDSPVSLITAIEISDQALSEVTRNTFYALSVFISKPETFSEEAATAVCSASNETLDALVAHGLVERRGLARYTLHQVIADYARLRLTDNTVYERMVEFFVQYVETHRTDYDLLDLEVNNIFGALQVAFERGLCSALVRGINAFSDFLESRGLYDMAEVHLGRARQFAESSGDSLGLVKVWINLGRIAESRGDYSRAKKCCIKGLSLARTINDLDGVGWLVQNLGTVEAKLGDYAQAETYFLEGLALARVAEDRERITGLLTGLGALSLKRGDFVRAGEYLREGLPLAREIGNLERVNAFLGNLGGLEFRLGNYVKAEEYWLEGLAVAQEIGHRERVGILLENLGVAAANRGDYEQAERYLQKGLAQAREIGHRETISNSLANLGWLEDSRGDYVQAEEYLQEGLAIALEMGHRENISHLQQSLGGVAVSRGDYARAEEYLQESLALARQIGHREIIVHALSDLGRLAVNRENYVYAEKCFQESLALAREMDYHRYISIVLLEWGKLYVRQKEADQAFKIFSEALEVAQEVQSQGEGCQDLIADAWYGRAQSAFSQGDIAGAYQAGLKSLSLFKVIGHRKVDEVEKWLAGLPSLN